MRICHFSDLHVTIPFSRVPYGKWFGKRAVGGANLLIGRYRLFARAEEKLEAFGRFRGQYQPDLVLCTGDYTALGLPGEYEYALENVLSLKDAPFGFITVPGNHDLYAKDTIREKRFATFFENSLQSDLPEYQVDGPWPLVRLIGDNLAVVAVNSARPNPLPWRSSGRIPEMQLATLEEIAADKRLSDRLVLIMTHYAPLLANGDPDTRLHGLRNSQDFLTSCAKFREAVILCGHVHRCYSVTVQESGQQIFCAGSLTIEGHEGFWCFEVEEDSLKATPGFWNGKEYELDTTATVTKRINLQPTGAENGK